MTRKELAREIYNELIRTGQQTTLTEDEYISMTVKGVGCLKPVCKRELESYLKILKATKTKDNLVMKPEGMKTEVYERYINDGFTDEEIMRIWQETLITRELHRKNQGKEKREITSSTYIRAEKRLHKQINDRFINR